MTGRELCAVYIAVKLHFTTENYNFFAGSGKAKISEEAFNKRKDKYKFHKLARMLKDEEVVPFLFSNFVHDTKIWSKDLISDDAMEIYNEWKRKTESLSYIFENEFRKILDLGNINDVFAVNEGSHPEVLSMFLQGELSIETMVILNKIMNFLVRWDKQITDDVIYPKVAMRIRKYSSFLTIDLDKMKKIIKNLLIV